MPKLAGSRPAIVLGGFVLCLVPATVSEVEEGSWAWGELFYDGTYETTLTISNACSTAEPVTIEVQKLPYLEIAEEVTVPPGELEVPAKITTPPQPPPPMLTGAAGEPGWGWVEPPPFQPAPGVPPHLQPWFHQPNFIDIKGFVLIKHPWNQPCNPNSILYTVTGHIHFRPPPPKQEPTVPPAKRKPPPRQVQAEPEDDLSYCVDLWDKAKPDPNASDLMIIPKKKKPDPALEACTDIFRGLALDLVMRLVAPYIIKDPPPWRWLPTPDRIRTMTPEQLLDMKGRVDAQRNQMHVIPKT